MTRGKSVAFLESRAQARAALALSPRPESLLALSPEAADALEEAGAPYVKAESLYDEAALGARADAVLDAQRAWAERVDDWVRLRSPGLDAGFRPARWHLFHLKRLFDALLFRAVALRAVSESLAPASVVLFDDEAPSSCDWRMQPTGSLHARCARAWAAQRGIPLVVLPPAGDERFSVPARRRRLPTAAGAARRLLKEAMLRLPGGSRKAVVWPDYDVAEMLGPLRAEGFSFVPWAALLARLPAAMEPLGGSPVCPLSEAEAQPFWRDQTSPEGIDLSSVAAGPLAFWWRAVVPRAWAAYAGGRALLRDARAEAVVVPIADSPEETALVRAARAEGVRVHIYQHGGFAGACEYPGWELTDLDHADAMLFYGTGSALHYSGRLKRYPDRKAVPYPVGSARLDALARRGFRGSSSLRARLREGLPASGRLVLYFPTMHAAYTRQLCHGELPDVTHWELQRDLARLVARAPACRLVYRPFEGCFASPMPRLLERERVDAAVERDVPLAELAAVCDAVVCDIPSTGLLEVLGARVPAFVMADARSVRLTGAAAGLLAKRAAVARSPEELLRALGGWLAGGPAPGDPADRSFLRAYGTHLDDGFSAARAAAFVAEAGRA